MMDTAPLMQFTQRPRIDWRVRSGRERRNLCGICHRQVHGLFHVPDTVWRHYVEKPQRQQIVCMPCWHWLVEVTDDGAYQTQHGGPVPMWSPAWRERHNVPADVPCPMSAERLESLTVPEWACQDGPWRYRVRPR